MSVSFWVKQNFNFFIGIIITIFTIRNTSFVFNF